MAAITKALLPALLSTLLSADANAAYIPFTLTLHINQIGSALSSACPSQPLTHSFGCSNTIGDVYIGRFEADSNILTMEGDNLHTTVQHFLLQIGNVIWDQDRPWGVPRAIQYSDFLGFRDELGFSSSFGFDVHGGVITGLRGGIAGPSDVPFIDFYDSTAQGTFFVADDGTDFFGQSYVGGGYSVVAAQAVPEPGGFALAALALSALGLASRRRT